MDEQLRIVVVAPDLAPSNPADERAMRQAERSRALRIGLLQHGFNLVAVLPADALLEGHLTALQPDLVIVDAESEARDTLEHVVLATREAPRPIVLFTDDEDTTHVKDAMAAGVTAYVVAGLAPQRIRPILEVALARFAHEQALRTELVQARTALHERASLAAAQREDTRARASTRNFRVMKPRNSITLTIAGLLVSLPLTGSVVSAQSTTTPSSGTSGSTFFGS